MRTLREGSRGQDVGVWQEFLQKRGHYDGAIDGSFGPHTTAATIAFQLAQAMPGDGAVGNQTYGRAMQLGLTLAEDDVPLPGGPSGGVSTMNDAWDPPAPPPPDTDPVKVIDPRVITAHSVGVLPVPKNPPPPVGWTYWRGNVTRALGEFATKVEFTPNEFPMGSFVQAVVGGQLVAARVEWHDYQGATGKRGCFRGTSLFRPRVTG